MTVFRSTSADFLSPPAALPTEAWQGAEIRIRSAENGYVDLPGPLLQQVSQHSAE